ncbi:uncharacterized protein LOC108141105 [Drosophila elegans]|uniref:uncharacterized protein LOC108141105 n=1 Tax=Drosophila elegans TaxID=30023 RepID=UPI0007E87DD7|nr:uncharacterized protein LOC108141105 [Drosophila elegans]XP_017119804.1 uncharacterized protein LOC108141105 [Drosophila elegans]XP_041565123.1 uncharacterized protein LOC108141105 [Drosophila elegans]
MSSHYLNSCVKVPIDPCNNCPAPVYNRPKLCSFGGKKATGSAPIASPEAETPAWSSQMGVRSLAKFYDSIPDYCDVKHLHQAEFYSTLESLRSTSRELRDQPAAAPTRARCASASSSSLGHGKSKKRSSKGKKIKKHPLVLDPVPPPPPPILVIPEHQDKCVSPAVVHTSKSSCLSEEYNKCLRDLSRLKSFKEDFAVEVADFKRSLKSFEAEFRRPKSISSNATQTQTHSQSQTHNRCQPTVNPGQHTAERAKCRREMLRRCFSVNDLQASASEPNPKPSKLAHPKMSNYFPCRKDEDVPKIQIQSPTASSKRSSSASTTVRGRGRRVRGRKPKPGPIPKEEKSLPPLSIFDLPEEPPQRRTPSVSPLHPVSRPNLAATLRAEVSRKKVKELKNNCTYHDPRPQFDWEVRKTPAWKSLSLNESHKALLSIRLATRKAEQAFQERQYELHMEMMRQRVKSAPLLLEGPTFWGPEVGKLTHTCRSEEMRHSCEGSRQRRKKKSECAAQDADAKLQQLRKIYGPEKSCSRQSQRSKRSGRRAQGLTTETPSHDSGDDLCSVDRAFL